MLGNTQYFQCSFFTSEHTNCSLSLSEVNMLLFSFGLRCNLSHSVGMQTLLPYYSWHKYLLLPLLFKLFYEPCFPFKISASLGSLLI